MAKIIFKDMMEGGTKCNIIQLKQPSFNFYIIETKVISTKGKQRTEVV